MHKVKAGRVGKGSSARRSGRRRLAIFTALLHPIQRPNYRVNTKVTRDINLFARALAVFPNLALIGLSLAAIVYGFIYYWDRPTFLWIHVFWCAWAVFAVFRATLVGMFPSLMYAWSAHFERGKSHGTRKKK